MTSFDGRSHDIARNGFDTATGTGLIRWRAPFVLPLPPAYSRRRLRRRPTRVRQARALIRCRYERRLLLLSVEVAFSVCLMAIFFIFDYDIDVISQ